MGKRVPEYNCATYGIRHKAARTHQSIGTVTFLEESPSYLRAKRQRQVDPDRMRHVSANRHGCTTAHGQIFVLQTWPQRLLQRCKLEKERCTVRCPVVRDCPSVTNPFPREPLLFYFRVDDHIDYSQLPKSNFISWLLAELLGSFVRPVPHSITTYPDPFGSPTPVHRISFELSPSLSRSYISALAPGLL